MKESTLNRVLFRSRHPWGEKNKRSQNESSPKSQGSIPGHNASQERLRAWAGSYYSEELEQTWELTFADGGLWVIPPGEAAQLLSPNGPDGMRSRGVNLWFTDNAFYLSAVDEMTADYIDNVWFRRSGSGED